MKKWIDEDPGLTLTARLWNDEGQVGNNTTSAFETPVPASVADYDIAAPEAGGSGNSGHYGALVPAWPAKGIYSLTFYDSDGNERGSIKVDTRDIQALTVEPSTALSALIQNLRTLANDTEGGNFVAEEGSKPAPNGTRTHFRLQNRNLVAGSVYYSLGSVFRSQSGFTVDEVNGIVTFASAPAAGDLMFDYNFQWFADADYSEFLTEGARALSLTDPATVVAGLVPSLLQFGLYYFYNRRATQYANKYSSSGGQAGQQVESVTGNFAKLAKKAWDNAIQLRDDFYQNQGKRNQPASAVIRHSFDPFTPRR